MRMLSIRGIYYLNRDNGGPQETDIYLKEKKIGVDSLKGGVYFL